MDRPAARVHATDSRARFRRRIVVWVAIGLVTIALAALTINSDDPIITRWRIAVDVVVVLLLSSLASRHPGEYR
jgi:FtsH-binding integral membrane protein